MFSFYFTPGFINVGCKHRGHVATRYIFKDWQPGYSWMQRAEVFARKSSQLRAKKEANRGFRLLDPRNLFDRSYLANRFSLPLSLSLLAPLFPPLRSIHVNPHGPRHGCKNTMLRSTLLHRLESFRISTQPLFLSLSLDHFPCQRIIFRMIGDRHGKNHALHDSSIYSAPTIKFQFENLIFHHRPFKAIPDPALYKYKAILRRYSKVRN